jgi:hypothetical protein
MKRFILGLFLISLGLVSTQCKPTEPSQFDVLPAITAKGANTFGCKVNGKVWIPAGKSNSFQGNLDIIYDETFENGSLSIGAYRGDGKDLGENFSIAKNNLNREGEYLIDHSNSPNYSMIAMFSNKDCSYYIENSLTSTGKLIITKLDYQNRIIAGTFEFTIYFKNSECGVVEITDGRFDMKY